MARRGARREAERAAGLAAGHPLRAGVILRRTSATPDPRTVLRTDQGVSDAPHRERRAHDKDGPINWETRETGHPPTRVRHPHVRGVLLEMCREARARLGDPVAARAEVASRPPHPELRTTPTVCAPALGVLLALPPERLPALAKYQERYVVSTTYVTGGGAGSRGGLRGRADLLDRNGLGRPDGRFPGRKAEKPR
ncbi:hypothetical protein [Streptomyces sp. NPDC048419]|uniref:hypothetical protein n=1 Tax=Streptomyces sp. NPDC048419 TaxID=3365547 RepID=UPI003720C552